MNCTGEFRRDPSRLAECNGNVTRKIGKVNKDRFDKTPVAKKRGKNRNFQAIPVQNAMALGTLADGVVISAALANLTQEAWMIRADLLWMTRGVTSGEGPLTVGIADGELSVTEIAEAEDASPTSQSDRVARERASRPVRRVGAFPLAAPDEVLNDGKPIRTTMKWMEAGDNEPEFYARNQGGATLTTGGVVEVTGTLFIAWK